jgi:hypothetical protein
VLVYQISQRPNDWRIWQTLLAHWYALTPDHLGFAVRERTEKVIHESLDDRGFAAAGVAANDYEPASVVDGIIKRLAQLSTLLSAPDDVPSTHGGGRSGRSHHEHYRATSP